MKRDLLLAVDIGNTTIAFALVLAGKVIKTVRIETVDNQIVLKKSMTKVLGNFVPKGQLLKVAAICSVVPICNKYVESFIRNKYDVDVKVVGRDLVVPMINKYRNPKQVGQDRLVGAFGAMKLYGKPLIVVDLGTAITFDAVSVKGEYLGGVIVPGLRLSAESLFAKTALLPEIDLKAPASPIGRTTQESILSGLFYGYGMLCQGMIDLLAKQIKAKPKVVMTGGHTHLMKRFVSPKIRVIDEDLVFKGIAFLVELA